MDLPPAGSDIDLIVVSRQDATLTTVHEWVQLGVVPAWSDCSGLSPDLQCWRSVRGYGKGDYGIAGLLRRGLLSLWYQAGSVRI